MSINPGAIPAMRYTSTTSYLHKSRCTTLQSGWVFNAKCWLKFKNAPTFICTFPTWDL